HLPRVVPLGIERGEELVSVGAPVRAGPGSGADQRLEAAQPDSTLAFTSTNESKAPAPISTSPAPHQPRRGVPGIEPAAFTPHTARGRRRREVKSQSWAGTTGSTSAMAASSPGTAAMARKREAGSAPDGAAEEALRRDAQTAAAGRR